METRTNIVLDEELVAKAMAKAGVGTKRAAVEVALRAYVREPDWKGLLGLGGSGVLADDYELAKLFNEARPGSLALEPSAGYRVKRQSPPKPKATARRATTPAPRRK